MTQFTQAARTEVDTLPNSQLSPIVALFDVWARHFGWYGSIDSRVNDLSDFTTPECTLTAHAPLWGTKEGEEKAVPAAEVRANLARLLKTARLARHDMHIAVSPDGKSLGLFVRIKARVKFIPLTIRNLPLALVVNAIDTASGLRINEVHEWPADDAKAAAAVLVEHHGWPASTNLEPWVGFGAAS